MTCDYFREFLKKFETALLVYSGAWGKLIHEKKNRSRKSRDTVPLNLCMCMFVHHCTPLHTAELYRHRVNRVQGFLSRRPNWLPPPPHPLANVARGLPSPPPPFCSKGGNTLACGRRAVGSQFGRRDRHSGILGKVQGSREDLAN